MLTNRQYSMFLETTRQKLVDHDSISEETKFSVGILFITAYRTALRSTQPI